MTTSEIKIGQKFQTYYGNGDVAGIITITRMTAASIFFTTVKYGHNFPENYNGRGTVQPQLDCGMWVPIN